MSDRVVCSSQTSPAARACGEAGVSLVELLVVMTVFSIVGLAIALTVMSASRTERYTADAREVMDEARVTFERIRREVRGARSIEEVSDAETMRFWLDSNNDGFREPAELIVYEIREITTTDPTTYELVRYSDAGGSGDARTIADDLVSDAPFSYDEQPPDTRAVTLTFTYDVSEIRGPAPLTVDTTVRLRNVA